MKLLVQYGVPAGLGALSVAGGYLMLPERTQQWLKRLGRGAEQQAGQGASATAQTLLTGNPRFVADLKEQVARQGALSDAEELVARNKERTDFKALLTQMRAERAARKAAGGAPSAPSEAPVKPSLTLDPRILGGVGAGSALVLGAAWIYRRQQIKKLRVQADAGNERAIRELARRGELL